MSYNNIDKRHLSFGNIDREVKQFDILAFTSETAVPTASTRTKRLIEVYNSVRLILLATAATPLIPSPWRAALSVFVSSLDEVASSFKAGKDLAIGDVGGAGAV